VTWTDTDAILAEMDDRREEWLETLQGFVRTPSENPPGDTREVASYFRDVLDGYGIDHETIAAREEMPNVIGHFEGGAGAPDDGPHLTFNGHLDTYPVGELDRWGRDPFSGAIEDGRIHGRGVSDMHGGFVATLAAFVYLFEHREEFAGRVSIAGVSDEETGGEWGTEYLVEEHPEYSGDAVLNGEPSSGQIRFAERGPVWVDLRVRGESAHSAYPHGLNAIEVLTEIIHEMRNDPEFEALADVPADVREAIEGGRPEVEELFGEGSTDFVLSPSLNVGTIEGGEKVNLTAEKARAEVDLRLPIGSATDDALAWVEDLVTGFPGEVSVECISRTEPTYTDPDHPLVETLRSCAARVQGRESNPPPYACGFGFTDCRFYRREGVPAAYYGPYPHNMGSQNEYITVEDFEESVAVHTLTAVEYVADGQPDKS
jgi:acetylornithine deacetylase/succinyl-diaminopimelate desuccinylase family protein